MVRHACETPKVCERQLYTTKATGWFAVAAANQPAGPTLLRLDVGGQCVTRTATRKVE